MTESAIHQELLFIDDFLHQKSDSVHWDHIKFNHPVYLEQIRIIPQNCLIKLKNGNIHQGATQPKKFKLEFYANNLNKKDQECGTLDKIGSLSYDDSDSINENLSQQDFYNNYILKPLSIPIDWLVVVGSYLSLSIAVIGVKAKQQSIKNINNTNVLIPQQTNFQNCSIALLPTPNLLQSTSAPNLINLNAHFHNYQTRAQIRYPNQRNFQNRHHPYNNNNIRPYNQFNNRMQENLKPNSPIKLEDEAEIIEVEQEVEELEEEVVLEDLDQQVEDIIEAQDEHDQEQVIGDSDSQYESILVKYYLDLDELKDESDLISKSNGLSLNQVKINLENYLTDYLKLVANLPVKFRLEKNMKKITNEAKDSIDIDFNNLEYLIETSSLIVNKNNELLILNFLNENLNLKNFKQLNLSFKLIEYVSTNDQPDLIDFKSIQINLICLLENLLKVSDCSEHLILKLFYSFNLILNCKSQFDYLLKSNNYSRLLTTLFNSNLMLNSIKSRTCLELYSLLSKINFYDQLSKFEFNSQTISSDPYLNELVEKHESIMIYIKKTLKCIDDDKFSFKQSLFSGKRDLAKISQEYNKLISLIDETDYIKKILILWSLLKEEILKSNKNEPYLKFVNSIESFFNLYILPSHINSYIYNGIEYLLNSPKLSNTLLEIYKSEVTGVKLSYSIYVLNLINSIDTKFKLIRTASSDSKLYEILKTVDLIQTLDLLVSIKDNGDYIIHFLCLPDGNFSNKYVGAMLNWLEFLIDDNLYLKDLDQSDLFVINTRCYLLNSLSNIFYLICKTNKNWSLNTNLEEIKKLNKLSSSLINYLIITKLKPSIDKNQSYFVLIEKLKAIMSILEPFIQKKEKNSNDSLKLIESVRLNHLIDSFKESIDKNLNLFFFKAFIQSDKKCINYLNTNITQICLIKNLLLPEQETGILNADLNLKLIKKVYLGHLINRNMMHIVVNFLNRLNDYFLFYYSKLLDNKFTFYLFEQLFNLIEPLVFVLKINLLNIVDSRLNSFNDFYVLNMLLDFNTLFNSISAQILNTNSKNISIQKLKHKLNKINLDLNEIIILYSRIKPKKFYLELSKFILKSPFNIQFGLETLNICLTHTNNFEFECLFSNESHIYLIDEQTLGTRKSSSFVEMLKLLSCTSSSKSGIFSLFTDTCVKLCLNSDQICVCLLKVFLDYSYEIIGCLKENFNLIEIDISYKSEPNKLENDSKQQDLDVCLYETNLVEMNDTEQDLMNENSEQNNLEINVIKESSQYKNLLISNLNCLIKFLVNFIVKNDHIKNQFLNLIKPVDKFLFTNYLKSNYEYCFYIFHLNNYFNQIDLNLSNSNLASSKHNFYSIQESILELNENLLIISLNENNSSSSFFYNSIDLNEFDLDESNKQNEELTLNLYLIKILIQNLNLTKLENLSLTNRVLNCLILMNKIYIKFCKNQNIEKSILNPIIKFHLKSKQSEYLIKFIKELASMLANRCTTETPSSQLIDLLNKFFIYVNYLAFNLNNFNQLDKLYDLFKWTHKNTNDILIDSITIQSSNSVQQHPLINLDKQIEFLAQFKTNLLNSNLKDDLKKLNYLLNQSKRFLKLLNDFEFKFLTDFETMYNFNSVSNSLNLLQDQNDLELNIQDLFTLLKHDINQTQFAESILMYDKDLYKKLKSNLEEYQVKIDDFTNLNSNNEDKLSKNEVINTRTGVRYKAPMRGGHTNAVGRGVPILNQSTSGSNLSSLSNTNNLNPTTGLTRHDSFRTRPPNTSRPPSLHVDDFYRIEQQQKQMNNSTSSQNNLNNQENTSTSSENPVLNRNNSSLNNNDCLNDSLNNKSLNNNSLNNDSITNASNNNNIDFLSQQQQFSLNHSNINENVTNNGNNNGNLIMIQNSISTSTTSSLTATNINSNYVNNNNQNSLNTIKNRNQVQTFTGINNQMNSQINIISPTLLTNMNSNQYMNQSQLINKTSPNSFNSNPNTQYLNRQIHMPHNFDRNLSIQYSNQFSNDGSNSNESIMQITPIKSPQQQTQISPIQSNQIQNQQIQSLLSPNKIYQNNFRYQQGSNRGSHSNIYRGGLRNRNSSQNNFTVRPQFNQHQNQR